VTVRVLVTDDQAPFRRAARTVVEATAGFELAGEASSGEEAVALAASLRPDLILMDVRMAGIGGIEAARRIAAAHPAARTVLVSSDRAEDLPPEAWTCGAAWFVHKSEFGTAALRAASRRDTAARP
jgi:DNA-binding NarL/FixJ family response regulator